MKFLFKKIYILIILSNILLFNTNILAKDNQILYSGENISNYFLGVMSANQEHNEEAFKYLKKIETLKDKHTQYNVEFVRTLILLEKFEKAFDFSKSVWTKDVLFFEIDLLLGLEAFLKKDYINAEKYFERLNKISRYNLFFDDFVGNILISWIKAIEGNENESFELLKKIPSQYSNLKNIQKSFLQCYFNSPNTQKSLEALVLSEEYNFSRYNFFLANYLISQNKSMEAEIVINNSRKKHRSNLLLQQAENYFEDNKKNKIINFFNCKNPREPLGEFFYILANLYSSEKNYQMSNFYLKISLFLNDKFKTNKALLAENYFYQKKYELSKKNYLSIKEIGPVYSWYASKSVASILYEKSGKELSVEYLKKEFKLIPKKNFEHYYDIANFYKDYEYYEKSIKYYSQVLERIGNDHDLYPKILDRRGTSYERIGAWEKAEKDLKESLKILPDQPHVLNYLAYSWVDKGINLDESLEMLKKATMLRENDGYIIDSLGWAYYAKKNYTKAEYFLQKAVELMPTDPVINDHYADTLWMLNKNMQARYFWGNILKLKDVDIKLKESITKKLISGLNKKL